jgi:glycosyltransferase involved in cell wall biosynthesis
MRRVLIISPHFPPTNAPDHQRVRMSLPYFRENGWDPVVLAVAADQVEVPLDPLLAQTLPAEVEIHRVSALPARWTRRMGLGNLAYRSWFQLRRAGDRLLQAQKFDLVYFSTTQFVTTTLGRRWLHRFGVPFVVDIQDPWQTDYYERPGAPPPPGGWKYRFARWQAARLEGPAWREAAGFVSVSNDYLDQLRARYPWFRAKPAAVIPFGAPELDFVLAAQQDNVATAFVREPGAVHLVNVGAVGPIMRPALELLFAGVRQLRATDPVSARKLRFHFIGTSYAPAGRAEPSVLPIAEAGGVGDLVREETGRVGYFTALKTLLEADALVIPGSDDPAYNPSKIAACFLARKPALALTPAGSALDRMVTGLGFATVASWPAPAGITAVTDFLRAVLAGSQATTALRAEARFAAEHTARARTHQQCALFDRSLGRP